MGTSDGIVATDGLIVGATAVESTRGHRDYSARAVPAEGIIMKPKPPKPEQDPAQGLKVFERLPAKTKERSLLQEQAVKSTGPENRAVQKQIR